MAEHRIVVPSVVGSSPITHPIKNNRYHRYRLFFMEWIEGDSNNQIETARWADIRFHLPNRRGRLLKSRSTVGEGLDPPKTLYNRAVNIIP